MSRHDNSHLLSTQQHPVPDQDAHAHDSSVLPSDTQRLPAPTLDDEDDVRWHKHVLQGDISKQHPTSTSNGHTSAVPADKKPPLTATATASPLRSVSSAAARATAQGPLRLSSSVQFPAFIQPWLLLLQRVQEEHQRQIAEQRQAQDTELREFQQQLQREITSFVAKNAVAPSPARPCVECSRLRERIARLEQELRERPPSQPDGEWHVREQALMSTLETLECRCNELDAKETEAASKYQQAQNLLERLVAEHKTLQAEVNEHRRAAGDAYGARDKAEKEARELRQSLERHKQEREYEQTEIVAAKAKIAQLTALVEQLKHDAAAGCVQMLIEMSFAIGCLFIS